MPKKSKKLKSKRIKFPTSSLVPEGLTLNDFANNNVTSGKCRIKKGTSNSLALAVKHMIRDSAEEKDWFEKSLEEFHIDSEEVNKEEEEYIPKAVKTKRKKGVMTSNENCCGGNTYPLDIWYILSRYIRPEDIGRFSQICKFAHAVTQSSCFWTKLYKRYYSDLKVLPLRLRPESMEKLYELRTCVIRSLFYLYPGFVERHKANQIHEPHKVLKRTCIMFWHQKGRGVYNYYFKMQESNMTNNFEHISLKHLSQDDLIETLGNINANSQFGCKVLQATCTTFTAISPKIFGETLLGVTSILSSDLRTYNLRLIFGPSHALHYSKKGITFSNIPEGSFGISLNSVVQVKVLDWWNPLYPNSSPEWNAENSNHVSVDKYF